TTLIRSYPIDLIDRQVEPVVLGVLEQQIFALDVVDRESRDARISSDAMFGVDHERAGLELLNRLVARTKSPPGGGSNDMTVTKDLTISEHHELQLIVGPATVETTMVDLDRPRRGRQKRGVAVSRRPFLAYARKDVVLFEQLA